MSKFNVHEWNHKRRLAEVELGRQGAVEIAREQALFDLQEAIDKASELRAVNGLEKAALDTILANAIKRRARDRGDLNEYSGEGPYRLKFQSPSIEDPLRTIYNRLTQLVNNDGTFRSSTVAPTTDRAKEQFDFWVKAILKDADGLNKVPYIDRRRALAIANKIEGANLTVPQILNLIQTQLG